MASQTPPRPLDLTDPDLRSDPYPTYRWYREHLPVYRIEPSNANSVARYLVTRWDDVEAGLKNSALRRTVHTNALWNQSLDQVVPALRTYARITREWPLFSDPPRHAATRRPINRVMEEARKESTDALLTRVVQRTIDALPAREVFDAAEDFGRCVVLQLNMEMLGIEGPGWKEMGQHLQDISLGLGNVFDPQRAETASHAMGIVEQWIEEAAQRRLDMPTDKTTPFLDRLLSLESAGAITGRAQLAATALLMIQAGQDTTSALLANIILTLLRHPVYIERLIAEPDFATLVVEEVLRYESPVQQMTRHASETIQIRGVTVNAGEGVSFLFGAANRDPAIFDEPDVFNPALVRPRTAAFGFGPHSCPGSAFGRSTAVAATRAFFQRFPKARLTGETICWKSLAVFRSVAALPVMGNAPE